MWLRQTGGQKTFEPLCQPLSRLDVSRASTKCLRSGLKLNIWQEKKTRVGESPSSMQKYTGGDEGCYTSSELAQKFNDHWAYNRDEEAEPENEAKTAADLEYSGLSYKVRKYICLGRGTFKKYREICLKNNFRQAYNSSTENGNRGNLQSKTWRAASCRAKEKWRLSWRNLVAVVGTVNGGLVDISHSQKQMETMTYFLENLNSG